MRWAFLYSSNGGTTVEDEAQYIAPPAHNVNVVKGWSATVTMRAGDTCAATVYYLHINHSCCANCVALLAAGHFVHVRKHSGQLLWRKNYFVEAACNRIP